MIELVKDILLSPVGSAASAFGIVTVLFFIAYKAGKIVEKFGLVNKMESSIDKIKDDISEIKAFIQIFRQENNPFAQAKSPISLTDKGLEVVDELHIKRIIEKNWDVLHKRVTEKLNNDDNPYTIQEVCFRIGEKFSEFLTKEEFDMIKKYAYKEGHDVSQFDIVFGILIRDKFFEVEKIDVSEVDIHDPKKK